MTPDRIDPCGDPWIARFESGRTPVEPFRHRDHIELAWRYLRIRPAHEVLARISQGLRRVAIAHGRPDIYHETLTWAYILIINQRMARQSVLNDWPSFKRANPDLFAWPHGAVHQLYRPETLDSDLARRAFVMPDRAID
jgi:hypothetical protein